MLSLEHIPCDLETKINIIETGSFSKLAVTEPKGVEVFVRVVLSSDVLYVLWQG